MATIDMRGATLSAADPPIGTNPNPDLAIKAPVRLATTGGNITLSGLQTIDGVALAAGDRVLVKDQTDATRNGIYNASTGNWTRTIDANNNSQWAQATQVAVATGTANGGMSWQCTAANPIVLGISTLPFQAAGRFLNDLGVSPLSLVSVNFNGLLRVVAARSGLTGGNAIIGVAIQDMPGTVPANLSFPCGLTGSGIVTASGTGNAAFGVFGRADIFANGAAVNELDCNNSFADSPATFPPNLGFSHGGSPNGGIFDNCYALGLQIVNIGPLRAHSGLRIVATGGAPFLAGIYADPPPAAGNLYGIFIDANSSFGPVQSALLRNTGVGQHLTLQTMAAQTPGNIVLQHIDQNSVVAFELFQSGGITTGNSVSNPGGNTLLNCVNTNATPGSSATLFAQSNAGGLRMQSASVADGSVGIFRWTGAGGILFDQFNAFGSVTIRTGAGPTNAITISAAQAVAFPGVGTTASAANAFLDNTASNNLLRSTSSLRYKRNVEDIEPALVDAFLTKARPVWYRSKAPNDRSDWSWYGFIAEEVAAIDPRLTHWSYLPEDFEEEFIGFSEHDGRKIPTTERRPKANASLVPDSVMYERITAMLVSAHQRDAARIAALEARISALH